MERLLRLPYKLFSYSLAAVLLVFAFIAFPHRVRKLHKELARIEEAAQCIAVDTLHIKMLVVGEDHRFYFHKGIDPIGIARAIWKTLAGSIEGGSSIEQQLVRTVVGDYRRCIQRKIVELLLASTVFLVLNKEQVARTYLSIAFFGTRMQGIERALERLSKSALSREHLAALLIAHLKYPKPYRRADVRAMRRLQRVECLLSLSSHRIGWTAHEFATEFSGEA